jgi:hypothetical protein
MFSSNGVRILCRATFSPWSVEVMLLVVIQGAWMSERWLSSILRVHPVWSRFEYILEELGNLFWLNDSFRGRLLGCPGLCRQHYYA